MRSSVVIAGTTLAGPLWRIENANGAKRVEIVAFDIDGGSRVYWQVADFAGIGI
jgi:hypothetical protein